jgi:hypothetical protein
LSVRRLRVSGMREKSHSAWPRQVQ